MRSVQVRRTTGFATVGTTWQALVPDGSWDAVLPVEAGDWVEVGVSIIGPGVGPHAYLDIATMVAGSVVNWISTATGGAHAAAGSGGVPGWYTPSADKANTSIGGGYLYQVKAADIVGGNVTFRAYAAGNVAGTWVGSTGDPAVLYAVARVSSLAEAGPPVTFSNFVGWGVDAGIVPVSIPAYSSEVLADTPLGYWRLGEASGTAAADSSGNARGATFTGTYTRGVTGLIASDTDKATTFTNGWAATANSTAWDSASITLEAWVKPTAAGLGMVLNRDHDVGGGVRCYQFRVESNGGVGFLIWTSAGLKIMATAAATVVAGSTYHLAATYDSGTGAAIIYVNGAVAATFTHSGTMVAGDMGPRIGCGADLFNQYPFVGVIDEAAVYGTALSAARIAAHYAARTTTSLASTLAGMAPVGQWMADETSGTSMLDSTANARHGTYTNSPTLGAASFLSGDVKAVLLDGVNDRISIPHNAAFNTQTVGFTVVIGFKINAPTADKAQVIIDKAGTSAVDGQWSLFWDNRSSQGSPQRLRIIFGSNTFDWSGSAATAAVGAGGVFTLREGGESGTNDMLRYNGAQKVTGPISGRAPTTRQIDIGAVNGATTPVLFLDGQIAFVAIFDRPITNAEITAIEAAAGV